VTRARRGVVRLEARECGPQHRRERREPHDDQVHVQLGEGVLDAGGQRRARDAEMEQWHERRADADAVDDLAGGRALGGEEPLDQPIVVHRDDARVGERHQQVQRRARDRDRGQPGREPRGKDVSPARVSQGRSRCP
jgi:hypothetical protein